MEFDSPDPLNDQSLFCIKTSVARYGRDPWEISKPPERLLFERLIYFTWVVPSQSTPRQPQ